jgi:hypothetical protein
MRSRLARVAIFATAALLTVSTACKKGDAPPADSKVTPTATAASAAASAAAAMELFTAMKLQTNIQDTAAAMIDSEVGRNPGLNPFRETMLTWLKKYMTWDAMVPELTKLYTTTFTDDELKQMAKFYGSPAGKKSLEKLPELMQRTAMIGAGLAQPHSDELKAAMTAKSEELQKQQAAGAAGAPGGPGAMGAAPAPGGQAAPARPRPAGPKPPAPTP